MSFLSGEAMFRALVSKDCYVTGSLRTSLFSFLLFEHEKRKPCYVLKGKKEEPFFALAHDISSYAERKLKTLQVMGEVYSVLSSLSLASRLIINYFPADYICCQSGQVLSG